MRPAASAGDSAAPSTTGSSHATGTEADLRFAFDGSCAAAARGGMLHGLRPDTLLPQGQLRGEPLMHEPSSFLAHGQRRLGKQHGVAWPRPWQELHCRAASSLHAWLAELTQLLRASQPEHGGSAFAPFAGPLHAWLAGVPAAMRHAPIWHSGPAFAAVTGPLKRGMARPGAAKRAAERRSAKEPPPPPSGMQKWLQGMLMSTPLLAPLAQQLAMSRGWSPLDLPAAAAAPAGPAAPHRKPPKGLPSKDLPLWHMFQSMDHNGDGTLDGRELQRALHDMGLPCSPNYVAEMMLSCADEDVAVPEPRRRWRWFWRALPATAKPHASEDAEPAADDARESGAAAVTWPQFRAHATRRDSQIASAFKTFDLDGNGYISARELGRAMALAGLPTTGEDLMRIMDMLDKDQSDSISYDEFRSFACLVPDWQGGHATLQAFMHTMPKTAKTGKAREKAAQNPLQPYVVYDLMLRMSMAAGLAIIALAAIREVE